eukprot:m.281669 g.281669  ORF g.281669 m.281669 type:complete len:715 (+) comp17742_c0_seq1:90-2234(+)
MLTTQARSRPAGQGAAGPLLLRQWDTERVVAWLSMNGFDDFVDAFSSCHLNGDHLQNMKAQDLCRVGDQPVKRRKALVKAVTRLKKQQANLVAASVAQRTEKRTKRQGIKSIFLRADSEEEVDSAASSSGQSPLQSSPKVTVQAGPHQPQHAAVVALPSAGYQFHLAGVGQQQRNNDDDSDWDDWSSSDEEDTENPIYGNQEVIESHENRSESPESEDGIYGNHEIITAHELQAQSRVEDSVSPATVMLPPPTAFQGDPGIVALPAPKACPESEEHVYVNDQAELEALHAPTIEDLPPPPPELETDTYQNMAECNSKLLQHTEAPSPIRRPPPPAVKPKPPPVRAKPRPVPSHPPSATQQQQQATNSRVTRSAFGHRTAFSSSSSPPSSAVSSVPSMSNRSDYLEISGTKTATVTSIQTVWDPSEAQEQPRSRSNSTSSTGSDGARRRLASQPRRLDSKLKIEGMSLQEPEVTMAVPPRPSLKAATRPLPPVPAGQFQLPRGPVASTRPVPPKPLRRPDAQRTTAVVARSAFTPQWDLGDDRDERSTVSEPTHCKASALFGCETTREESHDDLLSKLQAQVAMLDRLGPESKPPANCKLARSLVEQDWYRPRLDRVAAEAILQNEMRTGRFVIRESQSCPGAFTLSVLVDGEVRHVKVRDAPGGGICLRANATEREIFHDLLDMVESYCSTKLQLRGSIPFYLVPASANDLSEV